MYGYKWTCGMLAQYSYIRELFFSVFLFCLLTELHTESSGQPRPDGRIIFKKPDKRPKHTETDLNISTKKHKADDSCTRKSSSKKVKNSSLLSFDEDEEDDV